MRKSKLITAAAAITAISVTSILTPVQAAKILMSGSTSPNALGVTVLVADKSADINNLQPENVLWIDQQNVDADGGFTITLPSFDTSKYELYTNAKPYEFGEAKTKTVYVSATGTSDGSTADKAMSWNDALSSIDFIKEIILTDDITVTGSLPGNVTIKGSSENVKLTLDAKINLTDSLKLDYLTLVTASTFYANGYAFEITETVTSSDRLTVYGGAEGKSVASTDIKLYGGLYNRIYGGGNGGTVKGDTNVVVGGNVNAGDGINDDSSTLSPCYVFGGGNNAAVSGKTNITLEGDAVTRYLVGAGIGTNGTAVDTNIYIKGGKVMNVYAGSTSVALPAGVNTHITMTGGLAEALFGGCESVAMTGSTYVNLYGGEVSRRVYAGCYNTYNTSWEGDNFVTGTTTLTFAPGVSVNTKSGLSLLNRINIGVFSGSRTASQHDAEQNTIIYLDDSYSTYSSKIGEKGSVYTSTFKSFADYVVNASEGGKVLGTSTGGTVTIVPDENKYGTVNGDTATVYFANETATINSGDNTVKFADAYTATQTTTGVHTSAMVNNDTAGQLIAAVYDSTGRFVACDNVDYVVETDSYNIDVSCTLNSGETYTVKVFLWNSLEGMSPLMNVYSITVK